MEKRRRRFHVVSGRIALTVVFVLLGTAAHEGDSNGNLLRKAFNPAGSDHPHMIIYCDEHTSGDTVKTTTAVPAASPTLQAMHKPTACIMRPPSSETPNATGIPSNATYPATHPSPNSTDSTTPSNPVCLQGWAIFLLSLGAIVTVFLLAGIPIMVYFFFHCQRLHLHRCPRYNQKVYMSPGEHAVQLE